MKHSVPSSRDCLCLAAPGSSACFYPFFPVLLHEYGLSGSQVRPAAVVSTFGGCVSIGPFQTCQLMHVCAFLR